MDKRLAEWFASGDTGMSSEAIALWLSSGVKGRGAATPSDTNDLGRCIRLLDRIPEWRARMPEMAGAGGYWPTFARRWAELEASYLEDESNDHRNGKTYPLMKEVEDEARREGTADFTEVDLGNGMKVRFSI